MTIRLEIIVPNGLGIDLPHTIAIYSQLVNEKSIVPTVGSIIHIDRRDSNAMTSEQRSDYYSLFGILPSGGYEIRRVEWVTPIHIDGRDNPDLLLWLFIDKKAK